VAVTLVAAAAFSRACSSNRSRASPRRRGRSRPAIATVRLRLGDRSELGELARAFDAMADALAEAQDRLEARVSARTAELRALLALSNTIAVTTDLEPLLAAVLDRLEAGGAGTAAEIVEADAAGATVRLAVRGGLAPEADLDPRALPVEGRVAAGVLTLPLRVRERTVGALRVAAPEAAAWDEERRRLVAAIAAQAAVAIENVRLYERARDEAADDERRHLARELHDSVSQALYAIVLGGHAALKHVDRDPAKARRALDTVVELAEAALAEMRALIFELRPEALADVGLAAALHRQLDGLELRHKLATDRALETLPDLPFGHQQTLLRVVQEALHNVVKHARAERVAVRARVEDGAGGSALRLEVADDGVGFDPHGPFPGHLGLTSMRERLTDLGGRLEIDSARGAGTVLRAHVPLVPTTAEGGPR
jgi:signal transduction histidine kinase